MNPASFLESNVEIIRSAVLTVCRRNNIHDEEAEEVASQLYLKFIEDDYRRLRAFQGKSSLHTYLVTVVTHILIDMIREKRGRWRPSEKAKSLGQEAIVLEELLYRDNHTFDEAYQMITTNHRITISREQAYDIATKIPRRLARGSEIPLGDVLETQPDMGLGPEEIVERERHG